MIPKVENLSYYSRKDNILIAVTTDNTEIPLIKFKENFTDITYLKPQALDYIKNYMKMWPGNWENIHQQKSQYTLF